MLSVSVPNREGNIMKVSLVVCSNLNDRSLITADSSLRCAIFISIFFMVPSLFVVTCMEEPC